MLINNRFGALGTGASKAGSEKRPWPANPPQSIVPQKARGRNLHAQYRLTMQLSFVASLLAVIGLVNAPLQANDDAFDITMGEQETVQMEEIQQTHQQEPPPPPPRPSVPIAVADETVLEEEVLDLDAGLDLDEPVSLPAPPPPPAPKEEMKADEEDEAEIFVVVEEMPEIIGGTDMLYQLIVYPEIARKAGMEGMVVVQVVVEPNGKPSNPTVARSAGDVLDKAAVDAVMKLTFKPGKQRGKAVRTNFAIPVRFRLRDAK